MLKNPANHNIFSSGVEGELYITSSSFWIGPSVCCTHLLPSFRTCHTWNDWTCHLWRNTDFSGQCVLFI